MGTYVNLYECVQLFFQASEMVRRDYDVKCKILRELESKGETSQKIDKTRAVVKDLHSRIRVAIHRIHSISKRIEDLRDNELQPQLEELIEGYVFCMFLFASALLYVLETQFWKPMKLGIGYIYVKLDAKKKRIFMSINSSFFSFSHGCS